VTLDEEAKPTTGQTERFEKWFSPGVGGIGCASLLADVGHEVPTALLPSLLTSTLGAPASALGLIEGISDGLAGLARFGGGALADDPNRRRAIAVGGYTTTAVLSSVTGAATSVWQVGVLRAGAWAARGLRVPARNALLADIVNPAVYGRAYGFERAMDNLGAIGGPLLAIGLVALVGTRGAIGLSVIPGLLATVAILYAIRHIEAPKARERPASASRSGPSSKVACGRCSPASAPSSSGTAPPPSSSSGPPNFSSPGAVTPQPRPPRCGSTSPTTPPPPSPASRPAATPTAPPPAAPSPSA